MPDLIAHFDTEGIHLDYLSPMNEPTNSFSGCGQEGMVVPVAQRGDVVRALGATLAARVLATGISADESSAVGDFTSQAPQWITQSGTLGRQPRLPEPGQLHRLERRPHLLRPRLRQQR